MLSLLSADVGTIDVSGLIKTTPSIAVDEWFVSSFFSGVDDDVGVTACASDVAGEYKSLLWCGGEEKPMTR